MIGVVKKNLHFRKTAEKADNIIKILPKDQNVDVVEDLGEWLKVKVGRTTGYVMAEHIAFAPEAPEEPETPEAPEEPETPEAPEEPETPEAPEQLEDPDQEDDGDE